MNIILTARCNLTLLSMEINCLPFYFRTDGNTYQMILSHTLGRGLTESLIVIEDKLLERTRVYYGFNSKGVINFELKRSCPQGILQTYHILNKFQAASFNRCLHRE